MSTLKVKTSKGRKIEIVRMETSKQTERTSQGQAEKAKDESTVKMDESSAGKEEEHYETKSYDPSVKFGDPMFELKQEEELEEEYG